MSFLFLLFVFPADATLYAGDYCQSDGATGTCKKITECPTALENLFHAKVPENCGYDGTEPIVCCVPASAATITTTTTTTRRPVLTTTKRSKLATTTEYVPKVNDYVDANNVSVNSRILLNAGKSGCLPVDPLLTSPKTGQKAWNKCIDYQEQLVFPCGKSYAIGGGLERTSQCHHNADDLIIGGDDAELLEFPHMALLGYGSDPGRLTWQCGGALISDRFVLTAGHCIANKEQVPVSHVLLGVLKRSDDRSGRHRYKIRNIIPHPQYKSPIKYHDIALLELEQTVSLDSSTVPACLHTGGRAGERRAAATGWGLLKHDDAQSSSDVLQKVALTKFDSLECAVFHPPHPRYMPHGFDARTQACYGDYTKSMDTCQGDSGGPLQVKNKNITCMYTLVGVTSFGKECGHVGYPGMYTRVAPYLDWIEKIVWP